MFGRTAAAASGANKAEQVRNEEFQQKVVAAHEYNQTIEEKQVQGKIAVRTKNLNPEQKKRETQKILRQHRKEQAQKILNKELPAGFVLSALERRAKQDMLFKELLLYIPFLIVFIFYFSRGLADFYFVSLGLSGAIVNSYPNQLCCGPFWDRTYGDIDSPKAWYDWAEGVLFPYVWSQPEWSVPVTPVYVMGSNLLVGSVRIRTQRMRNDSCTVNMDFMDPGYPTDCWDSYDKKGLDTYPYGGPNLTNASTFTWYADWKPGRRGRISSYGDGGYGVELNASNSREEVWNLLRELRSDGFLDTRATRMVVTEFFTWTLARGQFTEVTALSEQAAGGGWSNKVLYRHFLYFTPKMLFGLIVDILFLLLIIFKAFILLRHAWKDYRISGTFVHFWLNSWTILESINLFTFIMVALIRWVWVVRCINYDIALPQYEGWPDDLNSIKDAYYSQLWLNSINVALCFFTLAKYAPLSSHVGVFVRAVDASQDFLGGVILLFVIWVLAYGIAGFSLYSNMIYNYSTIPLAISTTMLILQGDFDYQAMKDTQPLLTFVYFASFAMFGLFVLVNFIVSIFSGAFGAENRGSKQPGLSVWMNRWFRQTSDTGIEAKNKGFWESVKGMCRRKRKGRSGIHTLYQYMMSWATRRNYIVYQRLSTSHKYTDVSKMADVYISRRDLVDMVPPVEVSVIGETYFDRMWEVLVEEYNSGGAGVEELLQNVERSILTQGIRAGIEGLFPGTRFKKAHKLMFKEEGILHALEREKQEQEDRALDEKMEASTRLDCPNRDYALRLMTFAKTGSGWLVDAKSRLEEMDAVVTYGARMASILEGRISSVLMKK